MSDAGMTLKAWDLYFPAEEYTVFNGDVPLIMEIRKMIGMSFEEAENIARTRVYRCGYEDYARYKGGVSCISCAVSELVYEKTGELVMVEVRIEGVPSTGSFEQVNASNVGQLVGLVGAVSRVGYRRIDNLAAMFECGKCGQISRVKITNNIYRLPTCRCRGKTQVFLQGHADNRCVDRQTIRVQAVNGAGTGRAFVDVELSGEFVGSVAPGDVVEVVGLIASEPVDDAYRLKIECNNMKQIRNREALKDYGSGGESGESLVGESLLVEPNKGMEDLARSEGSEGSVSLSPDSNAENMDSETRTLEGAEPNKQSSGGGFARSSCWDFQAFKIISEDAELMEVLIETFYSSVVGHAEIKKGLVLALFGGTKKYIGAKTVRSEIHTLIIGDPGLGKSRILMAASAILPKSTLVSGSFCTGAGLTVSITHDPCSGEYMAEAGALVVADGGVCCVDEFDKIEDHTVLLEVMEDQVVTVAKGGVICSVPAHPTIVAAANPKLGHFDPNRSLRENIRFDSVLLSRFDLIYVLRDNLGEKEDQGVFAQILKTHVAPAAGDTHPPEQHRYSVDTLRAYIEYARNNVRPVLSKAAMSTIKDFYISIRVSRDVGIRNLESVVRLTEAVAKMQLKTIASAAHAQYAIRLYKTAYIKDEEKKARRSSVEELLKEHSERQGAFISKDDLVKLLEDAQVKRNPYEYIEILNCKGVILKVANGKFKILVR